MLQRALSILDIFMGLKDAQSNLEATTGEKIAIYTMYSFISLITIYLINL